MNSDELIKKVGVNIQEKAALIWNGSRPQIMVYQGSSPGIAGTLAR